MKKTAILICLSMIPCLLRAQGDEPVRTIRIDPAVVEGVRPLSGIGQQKTILDTLALRENVAGSLADVLTHNSTLFIKSYGRATLSTASFRGTAPSHTLVTWNGMKMNSPMLGMVDFSLIPSWFIDGAELYHGASSSDVAGGGLGGAVTLSTRPAEEKGLGLRYVQGIGSFDTYNQFFRVTCGNEHWQSSTRLYYATSRNAFKYRNLDKWTFTYDDDHNIIGRERPVERNRNGQFDDLHLLQEFYYRARNGARWNLAAWYMDSKRGVPMLDDSYHEGGRSRNEQHERTLRTTLGWDKLTSSLKLSAKAGYFYTDLRYVYLTGLGEQAGYTDNVRSENFVHTAFGMFETEYYAGRKWIFSGNVSVHQHFASTEDKAKKTTAADKTVGYDKARIEASAFASARWKPNERLGLAVNARQEVIGNELAPLIPAVFAEYLLAAGGGIVLKASAARNYRHPSLNDLYFMPGGNDSLRPERGTTWDAGAEFRLKTARMDFKGEAAFFDSHVDDWIVWLPAGKKGFWTPHNVKRVHSYGLELKGRLDVDFGRSRRLILLGQYAVTHSINRGDPLNWADGSIGRQLPYIPRYSSGVTGKWRWRRWEFTYLWNYYSTRYATSSNERKSKVWDIPPYYMNDLSLERRVTACWANLSFKLAVNNLFDEEYVSVLSHPMPGRNYGFFLEIAPKWNKK